MDGDSIACAPEDMDEEFEPPEPEEDFPKFLKWVKSKGIKPVPKKRVWKTIQEEEAKHPSLQKFLFPEDAENAKEEQDEEDE